MEEEASLAAGPPPEASVLQDCRYCKHATVAAGETFCSACGYPQGGTQEQQDAFAYKKARSSFAQQVEVEKVTKARNTLYWVAGLNMIPYLISGGMAIMLVGLVISGIYLGLALWSKSRPFPALLTALILFIALNLLDVVVDPMSIFRGIILKVIVLSALIYALRYLKRDQELPARS